MNATRSTAISSALGLFALALGATALVLQLTGATADDELAPGDTFIVEGSVQGTPFPTPAPISEAQIDLIIAAVLDEPAFAATLAAGFEVIQVDPWARAHDDWFGAVLTIRLAEPFQGSFSGRAMEWSDEQNTYTSRDAEAEFASIELIEVLYDFETETLAGFRPGEGSVISR